jgi:hypothetical protein
MASRRIDFQDLIPRGLTADPGLVVHLGHGTRLSGGGWFFTAAIHRRRVNAHGRDLKAEHVITICGEPGESLPDLLRNVAGLFEAQEPIEVGS